MRKYKTTSIRRARWGSVRNHHEFIQTKKTAYIQYGDWIANYLLKKST